MLKTQYLSIAIFPNIKKNQKTSINLDLFAKYFSIGSYIGEGFRDSNPHCRHFSVKT